MYVCICICIYVFRYILLYIWIPNFMLGWPKPINPMFQPWHICHYHCAWFAEVRPCSYYANIAWRRSSTSVLGGAKWMFFLQLRIQIAKSMIMHVYIYIYIYIHIHIHYICDICMYDMYYCVCTIRKLVRGMLNGFRAVPSKAPWKSRRVRFVKSKKVEEIMKYGYGPKLGTQ